MKGTIGLVIALLVGLGLLGYLTRGNPRVDPLDIAVPAETAASAGAETASEPRGAPPSEGRGPAAMEYAAMDVAAIDEMIARNGLDARPSSPALWYFAEWNGQAPARLVELDLTVKGGDEARVTGDLDLSRLTELREARLAGNDLSSIDVRGCAKLEVLSLAGSGNLRSVSVVRNERLLCLDLASTGISSLDLSRCPRLVVLSCADNPTLEELDVTACEALEALFCDGCALEDLDITRCPSLRTLVASDNRLTRIDTEKSPALEMFVWDGNKIGTREARSVKRAFNEEDRYGLRLAEVR